jgi:hypothetical protein
MYVLMQILAIGIIILRDRLLLLWRFMLFTMMMVMMSMSINLSLLSRLLSPALGFLLESRVIVNIGFIPRIFTLPLNSVLWLSICYLSSPLLLSGWSNNFFSIPVHKNNSRYYGLLDLTALSPIFEELLVDLCYLPDIFLDGNLSHLSVFKSFNGSRTRS